MIIKEGRAPKLIRTDAGTELKNQQISKYLKTVNVHHIVTQNETKASYAERVIKTLKHKLFRYLLEHRTEKYINVLLDTVYSYNHTVHRSLGDKTSSITKHNEGKVDYDSTCCDQTHLLPPYDTSINKVGQTVRISHVRSVFDREYSQKWTSVLFTIQRRYKREGLPVL